MTSSHTEIEAIEILRKIVEVADAEPECITDAMYSAILSAREFLSTEVTR